MSYADAVTKEAAWLNVTNDSLPVLTAAGWDRVDAYPVSYGRAMKRLEVWRERYEETRESNGRRLVTHHLVVEVHWPNTRSADVSQNQWTAVDTAVNVVLTRIRGLAGDKTHGGRFLAVGEEAQGSTAITVEWDDPYITEGPAQSNIRGRIRYTADEEITA